MLIGYARVSTHDQTLALQQDALEKAGCEQIFTDRVSGSKAERKGLTEALSHLRAGDTLVVWRLDRLKRFAKALDHPAPWKDESLLRRPEQEDSPSRRRGHGQKRGGANLGGQPLFDQTLRRYGTPGEVSHSEEASRLAPEDR